MAISGSVSGDIAGSIALGDQDILGPLMVKALTTNTGLVYIGDDGDGVVDETSGMPLAKGESAVFAYVGNLSSLKLLPAVDNEGVAWLSLKC